MRNKTGIFCIVLGLLLVLGAVFLAYRNYKEDNAAEESAQQIMSELAQQIRENAELGEELSPEQTMPELQKPIELLTEEDKKMTEVEIDGNLYIGYISIPALNKELPVMSTWSYPKLKIAPCRYSGSLRGEDLVLMAHNYTSHFTKIPNLEMGDEVFFVDMDGKTTAYTVVGKDVLDSTAVEVITSGEYDLTLFTCTYGGASRYAVYCDMVKE